MVEDLDAVFHALSSEPRRAMLDALTTGERTVGDLAAPFAMSVAGVSKHLKVLEGAGLVARRTEGRTTICTLRAAPLADAAEWVRTYERFWDDALDRLKALVEEGEE